jgi:hypothetical protein
MLSEEERGRGGAWESLWQEPYKRKREKWRILLCLGLEDARARLSCMVQRQCLEWGVPVQIVGCWFGLCGLYTTRCGDGDGVFLLAGGKDAVLA